MIVSQLRWERLLLVAALIVGVLVMHTAPEICSTSQPSALHETVGTAPFGPAHADTGDHEHRDGCGSHHALAVCLAILLAGALLLTAAPWFRGLMTAPPEGARHLAGPSAHGDFAAPQGAERLAQLCVSRR